MSWLKFFLIAGGTIVLLAVVVTALFWWVVVSMPGEPIDSPTEELTPAERELKTDLEDLVHQICGFGPRHLDRYEALQDTANLIEKKLRSANLSVKRQQFDVGDKAVANIEAELSGANKADEIIVVGAHYDTVVGSPGADDNASAVAAMIALARCFSSLQPERTVRFVAFVNEEHPFAHTKDMGSERYATACAERGDNIVAMLSLEMLGYYSSQAGSQRYPFPLNWCYPKTGNFVSVVGNISSRGLVHRLVGEMRSKSSLPVHGTAVPASIVDDAKRSDHGPFWRHGFPAVMVTDTANFRNPNYHTDRDTPDTLDYGMYARAVAGLFRTLSALAGADNQAE